MEGIKTEEYCDICKYYKQSGRYHNHNSFNYASKYADCKYFGTLICQKLRAFKRKMGVKPTIPIPNAEPVDAKQACIDHLIQAQDHLNELYKLRPSLRYSMISNIYRMIEQLNVQA